MRAPSRGIAIVGRPGDRVVAIQRRPENAARPGLSLRVRRVAPFCAVAHRGVLAVVVLRHAFALLRPLTAELARAPDIVRRTNDWRTRLTVSGHALFVA